VENSLYTSPLISNKELYGIILSLSEHILCLCQKHEVKDVLNDVEDKRENREREYDRACDQAGHKDTEKSRDKRNDTDPEDESELATASEHYV
jgi:hypothetical protein